MKLLTKENLKQLPALRAQENVEDPIAYVKFFLNGWTWYATEYDPETGTFFGLVDGAEKELGYFMLEELEMLRGTFNTRVERDRYFQPTPLSELR